MVWDHEVPSSNLGAPTILRSDSPPENASAILNPDDRRPSLPAYTFPVDPLAAGFPCILVQPSRPVGARLVFGLRSGGAVRGKLTQKALPYPSPGLVGPHLSAMGSHWEGIP